MSKPDHLFLCLIFVVAISTFVISTFLLNASDFTLSKCTTNSDCPPILNRTCVLNFCNTTLGRCQERTRPGYECSLDEQCVSKYHNSFYGCNTTTPSSSSSGGGGGGEVCTCYKRPMCVNDTECPKSNVTCASFYCINHDCVLKTSNGAQCFLDGQCTSIYKNPFYACNTSSSVSSSSLVFSSGKRKRIESSITNCTCYKKPQCLNNIDCGISLKNCQAFYCLNETCALQTNTSAQCSNNAECVTQFGQYYQCDLAVCSCIFAPPLQINFTCTSNANCGNTTNPCEEFKCNAGVCDLQLISTATCSIDNLCVNMFNDSFYGCNSSCQCYRKPECIIDADCPYNDALPCANFTCQNNRCAFNLNAGSNCSTDSQCTEQFGFGYACDTSSTTCSCYKKPQCNTTADCVVNVDHCAYVPCINGTCTQTRLPNATCITTADCAALFNSSLYICNQVSCQCTVSPFSPGYGTAFIRGNATSTGNPITKFIMGHGQTGITEGDWLFLGNWSGGVRVGNALSAGPQLWGVTFANDTFTVIIPGVWQVAIQVQGAKATGGTQLRNWMLSASKNSNTTTYNQSILPRDFSSVVSFATTDQILTTVGVTSFVASIGDTFRIFAMESLPSGGVLSDIDVYNFWILVQRFPV